MSVAALYADHLPYVRGVVRKLGIPDADVDDVAQEVFCVLLRRDLARPEAEARGIRRWLYQIARRVVSNHRRGRQRDARRREHAWEPVPQRSPETEVMHRQVKGLLDGAVAALPPSSQALYRMSEVEGLPGPEVARRLGLNPNTTYARVRALRRRLAQALLLVVLALAALLISQAGCSVDELPTMTRAPAVPSDSDQVAEGRGPGEVPDDRVHSLRGPALGHAVPAVWR